MRFHWVLIPILLVVLVALAPPVSAQEWSIGVTNESIAAGDNVTFAVTSLGDFHLRISFNNTSVTRLPAVGFFANGTSSVNWTTPSDLASGNYTAEVFTNKTVDLVVRVPETVQEGDYLVTAKMQQGGEMVCDTTGDPGWNELFQINWTNQEGNYFFKVCQNIADTDDAGTLGGLQGDAAIYAIRDHSLGSSSPEFQVAFEASGATVDPNPPSITPTYPSYLAIAIGVTGVGNVNGQFSLIAPPSGYTDVVVDANTDSPYLAGFASKARSSGMEDPSIFDFDCGGFCTQRAGWGAATIAVPDGVVREVSLPVATTQFTVLSIEDYQRLILDQLQDEIEKLKLAIEELKLTIEELREKLDRLGVNQAEILEQLRDLEQRLAELEGLSRDIPDIYREWWMPYALVAAYLIAVVPLLLIMYFHGKD